ncbi:MAG: hypothetical protein JNJ57_10685 [Saprospiraceae bacterium]|nr:hypothetical protein [Saprospiraceae bacterium]
MKRRAIGLFFLCTMSIQVFYNLGVLTYWALNRAYIASELCENRNNPDLHCEGKCYLKNKLADLPKDVSSNHETAPTFQKGIELALFPESPYPLLTHCMVNQPVQILAEPPCPLLQGYDAEIFHPPALPS